MKVLLINKFHYVQGGSERYYFALADAFRKLGHEVIFFSMKDDRNLSCEQSDFFVSNASIHHGMKSKIHMAMNMIYSKEAYQNLTRLLKQESPDLVILNNIHKQITCSVIDAIKDFNDKIKIFWTTHDLALVCPSYTMLNGKGEICEKCLHGDFRYCRKYRCSHGSMLMSYMSAKEAKTIRKHNWCDKVDLFICPSDFYQKKLEEAKFTKSKIVWMRNPLPMDTEYLWKKKDEKYILYFGRLSKEKGVLNLIEAMKDIDYKLYILGTGPIEEELKNVAASYKNIEFKGFQQGEALNQYIENARCVVLPSQWYENGPYSAMEAMAKGKPLIVSDLGGLPELVEDKKNGYIFHSDEELKEDILKMISLSEEEYSSMCEASLEKAKESFNPKTYVEKLIELVEKN